MKKCIIRGKKYEVDYRFRMVGNYYFKDKHGVEFVVDAGDVAGWCESTDVTHEAIMSNDRLTIAIAYARWLAGETEDGIFWWLEKEADTVTLVW